MRTRNAVLIVAAIAAVVAATALAPVILIAICFDLSAVTATVSATAPGDGGLRAVAVCHDPGATGRAVWYVRVVEEGLLFDDETLVEEIVDSDRVYLEWSSPRELVVSAECFAETVPARPPGVSVVRKLLE